MQFAQELCKSHKLHFTPDMPRRRPNVGSRDTQIFFIMFKNVTKVFNRIFNMFIFVEESRSENFYYALEGGKHFMLHKMRYNVEWAERELLKSRSYPKENTV